ncbi:MAG: cyclic nucleotide-gated ion channel, partial [Pseudomonadota bacterium]
PEAFGAIPDATWWTMATLTTVGYGDVSPNTPLGKIFGSVVMVIGLGLFALPIVIISTGFAQELGRRDFVVTWSLMSRIPLLAELDANAVAELMPHLHAHNYPPHWEVIHAGTRATSMYFIASGSVKLTTLAGEQKLSTGDFFGEIALIEEGVYDYSFTTTSKVRLPKLNYEIFLRLQSSSLQVADRIKAMAAARKQARAEGRTEPRKLDEISTDEATGVFAPTGASA